MVFQALDHAILHSVEVRVLGPAEQPFQLHPDSCFCTEVLRTCSLPVTSVFAGVWPDPAQVQTAVFAGCNHELNSCFGLILVSVAVYRKDEGVGVSAQQ